MNLTVRRLRSIQRVEQPGSVQAASRLSDISPFSILAAIDPVEGESVARIFARRSARGARRERDAVRGASSSRRSPCCSPRPSSTAPLAISANGCRSCCGSAASSRSALVMPDMLRTSVESVIAGEIATLEGGSGADPGLTHGGAGRSRDRLRHWHDTGERGDADPPRAKLHAEDPSAERNAFCPVDLAERPLMLLDLPQTATCLMTIFDILAKRPEVKFRTHSDETVRSAVAGGFGVSILDLRSVGRATADGRLIARRPLLDDLPIPTLLVIDMYGAAKPLFVRVFIETVRQVFGSVGPAGFSVTTPELAPMLLSP